MNCKNQLTKLRISKYNKSLYNGRDNQTKRVKSKFFDEQTQSCAFMCGSLIKVFTVYARPRENICELQRLK